MLSDSDRIWNRAALENGGREPRAGDRSLAALLAFHGLAMNGGVSHATHVVSRGSRPMLSRLGFPVGSAGYGRLGCPVARREGGMGRVSGRGPELGTPAG